MSLMPGSECLQTNSQDAGDPEFLEREECTVGTEGLICAGVEPTGQLLSWEVGRPEMQKEQHLEQTEGIILERLPMEPLWWPFNVNGLE